MDGLTKREVHFKNVCSPVKTTFPPTETELKSLKMIGQFCVLDLGGGLDFLALLAFFPSVISSFFTQNKGGPGPPGPSPRSATANTIHLTLKMASAQVVETSVLNNSS